WDIELAQRVGGVERADVLEVPARAERPACAIEHRNSGILVGVELEEGRRQRVSAPGVHGIAGFRPVVDDRPYRPVFLASDRHCQTPCVLGRAPVSPKEVSDEMGFYSAAGTVASTRTWRSIKSEMDWPLGASQRAERTR